MARTHKTTHSDNDTIVAVITPPGEGGIAALRIAGPQSLSLLQRSFKPSHSDHGEPAPFLLRHGYIYSDSQHVIDEVTAVFMPHGRSYTGLDQVEIFCHGGRQIVKLLLDHFITLGARMAEPGEFTKLAFLNGKIDLAKAEAVAELIAANSHSSYLASREHLSGPYSEHVTRIRNDIVAIISELEAAIDFPEDEITPASRDDLVTRLDSLNQSISDLIKTYASGRIMKEGFKIAIAGRPNAGKSSLFNLLLKHERALVNPAPGTTRDYLSEWVEIDGVAVNLIDTAGIRERGGRIERLGQDRAKSIVKNSDLVIWVYDLSKRAWNAQLESDISLLNNNSILLIGNKLDLVRQSSARKKLPEYETIPISCKTGSGVNELEMTLSSRIRKALPDYTSGLVVTSARHKQKLGVAQRAVHKAIKMLTQGESHELVAFELGLGSRAIDEIIGRVYSEQILEQIFGKFCIGK